MPSLFELQAEFRRALLEGNDGTLSEAVLDDGLTPAERIDVYRNNTLVSLKQVLMDGFPEVCRLVHERFFLYATDVFIRTHPPREACLFAYGAEFPIFLAGFPPSAGLPYLSDVARLEWLMLRAAHTPDAAPLPPDALSGIGEDRAGDLVLRLDPSIGLLESPWPVDRIWRANRSCVEGEAVDLDAGGARLEVRRIGSDVTMRPLDAGGHAFRTALLDGRPLEGALTAALAAHESFDLARELGELLREGAVVGFDFAPTESDGSAR